jgi:uncharacterized membrane protein YdbT with pleckstrin-like domain
MAKVQNKIILKPAKRILLLYLLAFFATLATLGFGLSYLRLTFELEADTLLFIWNLFVLVGLILLCYALLWWYTCAYSIEDECVTGSIGILSRKHIRVAINQIVDYQLRRSLLQRFIGIADLQINTASRDFDELIMRQVSGHELKRGVLKLDKLLNKDQRKDQRKNQPKLRKVVSNYSIV